MVSKEYLEKLYDKLEKQEFFDKVRDFRYEVKNKLGDMVISVIHSNTKEDFVESISEIVSSNLRLSLKKYIKQLYEVDIQGLTISLIEMAPLWYYILGTENNNSSIKLVFNSVKEVLEQNNTYQNAYKLLSFKPLVPTSQFVKEHSEEQVYPVFIYFLLLTNLADVQSREVDEALMTSLRNISDSILVIMNNITETAERVIERIKLESKTPTEKEYPILVSGVKAFLCRYQCKLSEQEMLGKLKHFPFEDKVYKLNLALDSDGSQILKSVVVPHMPLFKNDPDQVVYVAYTSDIACIVVDDRESDTIYYYVLFADFERTQVSRTELINTGKQVWDMSRRGILYSQKHKEVISRD